MGAPRTAVASAELSDESLATRVRHGDAAAFATLVRRHAPRFHRIAWRVLGRDDEAAEAVQEAFLRFWTRPDLWHDDRGARFTTWFHRIVVNQALDQLRRLRKRGEIERAGAIETDPGEVAGPDELAGRSARAARVAAAVAELPPRQQAALRLMFEDGLSGSEAAQAMGMRLKALQALVTRARTTLRARLADELEEVIE